MKYYFSTTIKNESFDTVKEKVILALKKEGFGVLTNINIKQTFKKKLDVDFKPYEILGACNPDFAYKALQAEDKIGIMLPCNVIIEQDEDESITVAVVDPIASMGAVENPNLEGIAQEVQQKLKRIIDLLKN
ncbi:MAG: DUF302 domain-containing protein [Lutibacter sp.]|uniref:DUF302 domain-containing protein n=1 Tax=Lutibacter sp. TaxID=1925666 RepID=UPI00299EAF74|nr:DUF302 domain-containing protein [Lutibacter sp.]MDX1828691.1 DUF302 domain-containing protein [Lutibacter sp.]